MGVMPGVAQEAVAERAVIGGASTFMTVRHLTVRGSNLDIGRTMGRIAVERYGITAATLASDSLPRSAEISFYLGDQRGEDGHLAARRSEYLKFTLAGT